MATNPIGNESARDEYVASRDAAEMEVESLSQRLTRLVWLRTLLFFVAAGLLLVGYLDSRAPWLVVVLGWLAAFAFLVAIVVNEHYRIEKLRQTAKRAMFLELLARLDRNWQELPEEQLLPENQTLAFADDLDVAGSSSLLALASLAVTRPGKETLQAWIGNVPDWEEVKRRQNAVQALVPERKLRLNLIGELRAASDGTEDVYGLPSWAESPDWRKEHPIATTFSYIGPACVVLGLVGFVLGAAQGERWIINASGAVIGIGFAINILLTILCGSWLHDIFQRVTGQHNAVYSFSSVFAAFEKLPSDGDILDQVRQQTTGSATAATTGFRDLLWLVRLANLQRDPMLYVVYLALQLTVLWDFRIIRLFENWKQKYGSSVRSWFASLGNFEAVTSIAALADGHAEWKYPIPASDEATIIDATDLGHPLLHPDQAVCNDLVISREKPLLLVTGSNMAGKSTFMRALGLNLLLSRVGSPVCATRLEIPQFDISTSIRVRDSLRDGVSFFMAELNRLKEVVDHAESLSSDESPPVFYLLDEILQGTNSRERQIAVASVLSKLTKFGAFGVLSTHDLDIASEPDIAAISQVVHFREYFENVDGKEQMRFDYKMHPGPTPTTNALKLLALVGLT
ncbi:MAG: MutS family DNA mismatch repair protein [Aureliella sp.]